MYDRVILVSLHPPVALYSTTSSMTRCSLPVLLTIIWLSDEVVETGLSNFKTIKKAENRRATDADGDGKISREEYIGMYGSDEGFDALDLDGSGFIDASDMRRIKSKNLTSGAQSDAIDLVETELMEELRAAVKDATEWLEKQPEELALMVETRRGVSHMFLGLSETAEEYSHLGTLGENEAELILNEIRRLQSQNEYIFHSTRFKNTVLADCEGAGNTSHPVVNQMRVSMGQDPHVDETPVQAPTNKFNVDVNQDEPQPSVVV